MSLPATHRALVQRIKSQSLQVEEVPGLRAGPGSVVIKVLGAPVLSYMRDVYDGSRPYFYPVPLVTGFVAIGRVAAVGPDSTHLQPGQLVYADTVIRSRDDPGVVMLSGIAEGSSEGSKKLFAGEWRDSTYAEYAKMPLENCHALNEDRICGDRTNGGHGHKLGQLNGMVIGLTSYGGFRSVNLQPGETVVVAPATGQYGSAAVVVALAMGARVIAMGRNTDMLSTVKALSPLVETVQIQGDVHKDLAELKKFGPIDAYLDISSPKAQGSTHLQSCILALRPEGRVALMGGFWEDVSFPHRFIMANNITLKGKWMYLRSDITSFIRLVELGTLKLDHLVQRVERFALEDWKQAFDTAADKQGTFGEIVILEP